MSKRLLILNSVAALLLLALVALIAPVLADTASVIHVPGDYATIQLAVDNASDGDTIVIAAGTYPGGITITGKSLTLHGAGAGQTIIDGQGTQRGILSHEKLTLLDLTVQNGNADEAGAGVYCTQGLVLTRCHILSNTTQFALAPEGGAGARVMGNVTIADSLFANNRANGSLDRSFGGGLLVSPGDAAISDSVFRNCRADYGGGLVVKAGQLIITRTQFISNTAAMGGGGAAVLLSGSVEASDCLFQDNLAQSASNGTLSPGGGGLLLSALSAPAPRGGADMQIDLSNELATFTTTLRGTTFLNNTSETSGGGVSTEGAVIVSDCRFEGNTALGGDSSDGGGGALYQADYGHLGPAQNSKGTAPQIENPFLGLFGLFATVEGTTILGNTALGAGGGLCIDGFVSMSDCRVEANVSYDSYGGGVYATYGGMLVDSQFISNTAYYDGGGASLDGFASVDRCLFERNLSGDDGGGLAVYSTSPILLMPSADGNDPLDGPPFGPLVPSFTIITDTQFIDNVAWWSGGGLSAHGDLVASNTLFERNWTNELGGGASVDMTSSIIVADGSPRLDGGDGPPFFEGMPANALLWNVRFISNTAYYDGGGIYASGELLVSDSRFERNDCSAAGWGGGASAGWYGVLFAPADGRLSPQSERGLTGYLFHHAVTNTVFCDNGSAVAGGGLSLSGDGSILGSTFERNRSAWGGGADSEGTLTIDKSRFLGNSAAIAGGGVSADAVFASNCLLADNVSDLGDGHAIYQTPSSHLVSADGGGLRTSTVSELAHCTIANSAPLAGWAVALAGPYGAQSVINTLFSQVSQGISATNGILVEWYNLFDNVPEPVVGGLMSFNSLVGSADFVDPATGDYHLGRDSDAIDVGSLSPIIDDLDLQPRDTLPDIGCYEYAPFNATVGPDPFCPSWDLYYRWTYKNKLGADAANVVVTYTLPANTCCPSEWESTGPAWSYDEPSRTVTWLLGTIAADATVEGTLKVHTFSSLNDGDVVPGSFALTSDLQPVPLIAKVNAEASHDECGGSGQVQPTATPTITPTPTATPLPPGFFCLPVIVVS